MSSIKVIIKTKKQRTVIKMFSTKCKSLNFRNSKSYFSPQNAHSSIKKVMNILTPHRFSLLRDCVSDAALQSQFSTPFSLNSKH